MRRIMADRQALRATYGLISTLRVAWRLTSEDDPPGHGVPAGPTPVPVVFYFGRNGYFYSEPTYRLPHFSK